MDAAGSCLNAVVVAIQSEQHPVCGSEIVDEHRTLESVSNLKDMDGAAVATSLPRDQPINHESQIFIRTCNRSIILNVNLASDSVQEVKRLVEEREGIPVSEQHLIFGGKPLRHGTFLRDYDALGHQCTLNVFARIRGGNRTRDMRLSYLMGDGNPPPEELPPTWNLSNPGVLTQNQSIHTTMTLGPVNVPVLTEVGRRILNGVLTCILSAHRADLSFNGALGTDNLWVHGYKGANNELVVSRIYVGNGIKPTPRLDDARQMADYRALKEVIGALFPGDDGLKTQHVGSIYELLGGFTGDFPDSEAEDIIGPVRRTHLLQAYAAMVSSPVAVSTMCLNLKRFYDQLDHVDQRDSFEQAMGDAQVRANGQLPEEVGYQPLFRNVYDFNNDGNIANHPYAAYDTGMELFNFARNWFTHAPAELRGPIAQQYTGLGLPLLDYIFTYHFNNFIPQALFQLYKTSDDHNLFILTRVLVPLA